MEITEKNKNLMNKLAKMQLEIPTLEKDAKGYGYKYTSLDTIRKNILPLMEKYKIGIFQPLTSLDGKPALATIVTDDEGGYLEFITPLPQASMANMNEVQARGATFTYYRRYALSALLGITSDEDVDGNPNPQNNGKQPQQGRPQQSRQNFNQGYQQNYQQQQFQQMPQQQPNYQHGVQNANNQ